MRQRKLWLPEGRLRDDLLIDFNTGAFSLSRPRWIVVLESRMHSRAIFIPTANTRNRRKWIDTHKREKEILSVKTIECGQTKKKITRISCLSLQSKDQPFGTDLDNFRYDEWLYCLFFQTEPEGLTGPRKPFQALHISFMLTSSLYKKKSIRPSSKSHIIIWCLVRDNTIEKENRTDQDFMNSRLRLRHLYLVDKPSLHTVHLHEAPLLPSSSFLAASCFCSYTHAFSWPAHEVQANRACQWTTQDNRLKPVTCWHPWHPW